MQNFFIIQDMKSRKFFQQYRIDHSFCVDPTDARQFDTKEEAKTAFSIKDLQKLFKYRFLQIIEIFLIIDEDLT